MLRRWVVVSAARAIVALAIGVVASAGHPAWAADTATLERLVTELLDRGLVTGSQALADAEKLHKQAAAVAPADTRPDYALALVLIKQYRYAEAAPVLDRIIKADPKHTRAREARVWISLLLRKYPEAIFELEDLGKQLAAAPPSDPDEARDAALFLGRMYGFLEGPVASHDVKIRADDLRASQNRFVDRLPTAAREALDAGREEVVAQFLSLTGQAEETRAEAKVEEQEQKDADKKLIAAEQERVAAEQAALAEQFAQARSAAEQAVNRLEQQILPLNAEIDRLNAQIAIVSGDVSRFDLRIAQVLALADMTADLAARQLLLLEANQLGVQRSGAVATLQNLRIQGAQVVAQRDALLRQRDQVLADFNATARRLGFKEQQLGDLRKRLNVAEREASKPPKGSTPKVTSISKQAAGLTTYQPFPLERERRWLLATFE